MIRQCLCLFAAVFPLYLYSQSFSLGKALSAPYCSDLIASDNGEKIAWTVVEEGVRTIYGAATSDFEAVKLYSSNGDDGQMVGSLGFDHQASNFFFVKGSAPNKMGEIANPTSEVKYPQRYLFRVDLISRILDTLGAYSNYVVSPDDDYLLISTGSRLVKYNLADKKMETLIEMRGSFSDVSFHPDGRSIIFVSNRGDHSFIGLYEFGQLAIKWIAPSLYRDQYPVWSPDGQQIAFIRAPGKRKGELDDITGGNPFSIIIYDLEAEKEIEAWQSPSDDGGFAQYYHEYPLRWANTGQILFYSEHEGYMKIYQLDPGSGLALPLIDGNCEMEHSNLSPLGDQLIFSTNCGDIDRRHLYVYDLAKKALSQVTEGDEIETNPFILKPGLYVFREGGYDFPTRIAKQVQDTKSIVFPLSLVSDYPGNSFTKPSQVVFKASDGATIHGQLFINEDGMGNKPGILFMHGGPIRQMLLGYHYSDYYANAYVFNQYLASQGYAVLSVNYRSGIGYGKEFRRAPNQGPRGASEYQDIVAAAQYLQRLDAVDSENIGLWGGSYGGLLTAQGLAKNSDIFKAGVDFHGVHDWSWRATDFSKGGFWGITEELMDLAYHSSPASEVTTWESPVLLVHGDDDRNVMFGQSVDLAARLKEKGVHYEVLVLPDEVHGFYRYQSWLKSYLATADFFDRFLKQ